MKAQLLLLIPLCIAVIACQNDSSNITTATTTAADSTLAASAPTTHPEGEKLHQEKCAGCHMAAHNAAFYQRTDRKVKSYERLQSQVRLCNSNLDLALFDDDMTMIGEYLNESFYKFPAQ